jgi:hypothetical protein
MPIHSIPTDRRFDLRPNRDGAHQASPGLTSTVQQPAPQPSAHDSTTGLAGGAETTRAPGTGGDQPAFATSPNPAGALLAALHQPQSARSKCALAG